MDKAEHQKYEHLISAHGQALRYLVVDDSIMARKTLIAILETFGGEVVAEAADGVQAIYAYLKTWPDIVFLDITMPNMEGMEAAAKMIATDSAAQIIMVSAESHQEKIMTALQIGARGFVRKPIQPQALYEAIKSCL
jgi:two-component system chemotaxis response regulator CheY